VNGLKIEVLILMLHNERVDLDTFVYSPVNGIAYIIHQNQAKLSFKFQRDLLDYMINIIMCSIINVSRRRKKINLLPLISNPLLKIII